MQKDIRSNYTVSQKNMHQTFVHIIAKYWPIFIGVARNLSGRGHSFFFGGGGALLTPEWLL